MEIESFIGQYVRVEYRTNCITTRLYGKLATYAGRFVVAHPAGNGDVVFDKNSIQSINQQAGCHARIVLKA